MKRASVCMLICLFACLHAIAQTDSITNMLDEVNISATRFSEKKRHVPQQVASISAKKIEWQGQPTTAEMLMQSGHVFVQKSQQGGGSPVMRGFEANKILIVIDGVRMNNAIFRGGHLQNVITLDQNIVEKTELLFGPSSVMYGSDALGGVLAFYTRTPDLSGKNGLTVLNTAAYLRYATAAQEKTAHIDFSLSGPKASLLTSFTYSNFDDLRQGSHYYKDFPNWGKRSFYVERIGETDSMVVNNNPQVQKFSGYKQYDLLQKFFAVTGKFKHTVNIQFSSSNNIPRYDRLTETNSAGLARSAQWYYGPQKRSFGAYTLQLPSVKVFDKAQLIVAYQNVEESRHNRNFRSDNLNHRTENVKVFTFNADFKKDIRKTEFSYGLEYTHNKVSSQANRENINNGNISSLDTRYPDGGSKTTSLAIYTSLLQKFNEKFDAVLGARFSHNLLHATFNDKTFFPFPFGEINQQSAAFSGNAGIIYRPLTGWKISAIVSTGFRNPNVDDVAKVFESTGGRLIIPNPDVKPEQTVNYELGIVKNINGKLEVAVNGWYGQYKDVLTLAPATYNGKDSVEYNGINSQVITTINEAKAYYYGFSGTVKARLAKYFSAESSINYTKGRIREEPKDYPLDHIAPLFGKLSVSYVKQKMTAEFYTLFNGKKDSTDYNLRGEDNQAYSANVEKGFTPAWFTLNVRAGYRFNRHFSARVAVENLTDKFYRVFASGLSAPGRNFVITIAVKN